MDYACPCSGNVFTKGKSCQLGGFCGGGLLHGLVVVHIGSLSSSTGKGIARICRPQHMQTIAK